MALAGSKAAAALGSACSQGASSQQMRQLNAAVQPAPASRCRTTVCQCYSTSSSAPSSSGRADAQAVRQLKQQYLAPAAGAGSSSSKYERIVAFVEAHATPVLPLALEAAVAGSCVGSASSSTEDSAAADSSWHHSYDEEAEEGELCDEPHIMAFAAVQQPIVAAAGAGATAATQHSAWSYGSVDNPKPWCFAWDEEAEGGFELDNADRPLTLAQLRAEQRSALHEARHAARLARRLRRSQLHPRLGDLEHMQAWLAPGGAGAAAAAPRARSPASQRYQQLLAFVAGDSPTSGHYRKPLQWHLTFDEDVHGPDAPDAVLGSC